MSAKFDACTSKACLAILLSLCAKPFPFLASSLRTRTHVVTCHRRTVLHDMAIVGFVPQKARTGGCSCLLGRPLSVASPLRLRLGSSPELHSPLYALPTGCHHDGEFSGYLAALGQLRSHSLEK